MLNVWLSARNERRRSQPIVLAQPRGNFLFSADAGAWVARAVLKNEGGGPAFNVSFGLELGGSRFPYRLKLDDPAPSRQRVLPSGLSLPQPDAYRGAGHFPPEFSIMVDSIDVWGLGRVSDDARMYWCVYENAHGETWETRNPADRGGELKIRRVRFRRASSWRLERARKRTRKRGLQHENRIAAGMAGPDDGGNDVAAPSEEAM